MKIKATVHYEDTDLVTIRTEDGGVASLYHNGTQWSTDLYQDRSYDDVIDWDKLGEGKGYCKEWSEDVIVPTKEMIMDALNWLVMSTEVIEWDISEHYVTTPKNITTSTCTYCGEIKPRKDFREDTRKRNGIASECRDCHNKIQRDIRAQKKANKHGIKFN